VSPGVACSSVPATQSTPYTADCAARASLNLEHAFGQELGFEMTVSSPATPAGWSVRLKSGTTGWNTAPFTTSWSTLIGETGMIALEERLPFMVEATPSCLATSTNLDLTISLDVTLGGQPITGSSSSITHQLLLAAPAVPEPTLSFTGSLDFGEIIPSSEGDASEAHGSIVLDVAGLAASCSSWDVTISGGSLSSDTGDVIPGGNLQLVAVNGVPLPGGPCAVTAGCLVATFPPESGAGDSTSVTLSFLLTIPPTTTSGTFLSGISAEATQS
jgi:hypothetical protein